MQNSVKEKEPNRSLVSVRDLRRAKEASQKQMVAFSPEKTALLPALLHTRSSSPSSARSGGTGVAGKGFHRLKAPK